jgi:hypothetical protein
LNTPGLKTVRGIMSSGLIGSRRSALSKACLARFIWYTKVAKD